MYIIPAIDLKDHKVVRLRQGRRGDVTVYAHDALTVAEQFVVQGATRLHVVDLNAAFDGSSTHFVDIERIAKELNSVILQVGGGIRSLAMVQRYLDCGVQFCILGTAALSHEDMVRKAATKYPGRIILGIDARDGFVATHGWEKTSEKKARDVVKKFIGISLESIIYTDIAKDGMMSGVNLPGLRNMKTCGVPVIASGGVSSLADLKSLQTLGVYGAIVGKAIYEKAFSLREAITLYA